jgi:DNA modification methylase
MDSYNEVSAYVDSKLNYFSQTYKESKKPIKISFRRLCSKWSWAKRSDVYTHALHRYPARLFPYIPIFFLSTNSYASKDDIILDPFAGSGTVLLECMIHPFLKRNSYGVEINPLARLIAKVKTTPLDNEILADRTRKLFMLINGYSKGYKPLEFKNIDFWFTKKVQKDLAIIRAAIQELPEDDYQDFFWVCLSSIIKKVSLADPSVPPPVLLKPEKFKNNPKVYRKVIKLFREKVNSKPINGFKLVVKKNIQRVNNFSNNEEIFNYRVKSEIIWDDARRIKRGKLKHRGVLDKKNAKPLKKGSIGLIITSPPYLSAQKYVRSTRLELLCLGLINEEELRELDRMTIGTERVYKNDSVLETEIEKIDKLGRYIYAKSRWRGQIFFNYFNDMIDVINEAYRVLKGGGRFLLIIGNNRMAGKVIKNYELLSTIAERAGFKTESVLMDRIRSRGMITKRHDSGGLINEEFIIVLRKEES